MLSRQVERWRKRGFIRNIASELEFFLFNNTYHELSAEYRNLTPSSDYRIDYHTMQPTQDEPLMRALRNQMCAAGMPVESSKGEWGRGQHEINFRYANRCRWRTCTSSSSRASKRSPRSTANAVTFMAKPWRPKPAAVATSTSASGRATKNLFWGTPRAKRPEQDAGSGSKLSASSSAA